MTMGTIKDLEERLKRLEERVLVQEETIKRTSDFVQHAIDTQFERKRAYYKERKEDEARMRKEAEERSELIKAKMRELGYKIS
jgi:uncharacterized coiled-coil protein SlyX